MPMFPFGGLFANTAAQPMAQPVGDSGGLFGAVDQWRENNPGVLSAIGSGLMNRNLAGGFQAAAQLQQQAQQRNRIARYLIGKGYAKTPDEALALMSDPSLLKQAINPMGETGLTPIWGTDAQGKSGFGVLDNKGTFRIVNTPGFTPLDPFSRAFAAASGKAQGTGFGGAEVDYADIASKLSGLQQTAEKLDDLANKATYTGAGQMYDIARRQLNMPARPEAIARVQYESTVRNQILPLLRQTFGAQFTAREGDKLEATLGDPNLSPPEKQAALKAWLDQQYQNVNALAARTGNAPIEQPPFLPGGTDTGAGASGGAGVTKPLIYNPDTGLLE